MILKSVTVPYTYLTKRTQHTYIWDRYSYAVTMTSQGVPFLILTIFDNMMVKSFQPPLDSLEDAWFRDRYAKPQWIQKPPISSIKTYNVVSICWEVKRCSFFNSKRPKCSLVALESEWTNHRAATKDHWAIVATNAYQYFLGKS